MRQPIRSAPVSRRSLLAGRGQRLCMAYTRQMHAFPAELRSSRGPFLGLRRLGSYRTLRRYRGTDGKASRGLGDISARADSRTISIKVPLLVQSDTPLYSRS